MTENEKRLLDMYAEKAAVFQIQYETMGKLLDDNAVKRIVDEYKWQSIYIYGGAYLGVHLWKVLHKYVHIEGIIDEKEDSYIPVEGVAILNISMLKKVYKNEPIIITPIEYGNYIKHVLSEFIDESELLMVNELL